MSLAVVALCASCLWEHGVPWDSTSLKRGSYQQWSTPNTLFGSCFSVPDAIGLGRVVVPNYLDGVEDPVQAKVTILPVYEATARLAVNYSRSLTHTRWISKPDWFPYIYIDTGLTYGVAGDGTVGACITIEFFDVYDEAMNFAIPLVDAADGSGASSWSLLSSGSRSDLFEETAGDIAFVSTVPSTLQVPFRLHGRVAVQFGPAPTPLPTNLAGPTPDGTPTATNSATASSSASPTASVSATASAAASEAATLSPTVSPAKTPTVTATGSRSITPTITPAPTYWVVEHYAGSLLANWNNNYSSTATLSGPTGVTLDSDYNLYVAEAGNHLVRKFSADGNATTYGTRGSSGLVDGQASNAKFNGPVAVVVNSSGHMFVSEAINNAIRIINPQGYVTTLAGGGSAAYAEGVGTNGKFSYPLFMALTASGNLLVTDLNNYAIRSVDTTTGLVSTWVGNPTVTGYQDGTGTNALFTGPSGIAIHPTTGVIYVADSRKHVIRKVNSSGYVSYFSGSPLSTYGSVDGVATNAKFNQPYAIAFSASGTLFVADLQNHGIRSIDSSGTVTTYAGRLVFSGNVDATGTNAKFNYPAGVVVDPSGNVLVGDRSTNLVRKIDTSRTVSRYAGRLYGSGFENGVGTDARFYAYGIALDAAGNILVADWNNHLIRLVDNTTTVTTYAGTYALGGSVNGALATALFNGPTGIAVDANGTIFVAGADHLIRKIDTSGNVSLYAGSTMGLVDGVSTSAKFKQQQGIAVDASGNVFVADTGNNVIRKIDTFGNVTTYAGTSVASLLNGVATSATFSGPTGVAVDSQGNVFVADKGNNCIRKIDTQGSVTTFAGSSTSGFANAVGTSAKFAAPYGITIDASDVIYVADGNHAIRMIDASRKVTTVAGATDSTAGLVDGIGTSARFNTPQSLCMDPTGTTMFVWDRYNYAIRKMTKKQGYV